MEESNRLIEDPTRRRISTVEKSLFWSLFCVVSRLKK